MATVSTTAQIHVSSFGSSFHEYIIAVSVLLYGHIYLVAWYTRPLYIHSCIRLMINIEGFDCFSDKHFFIFAKNDFFLLLWLQYLYNY